MDSDIQKDSAEQKYIHILDLFVARKYEVCARSLLAAMKTHIQTYNILLLVLEQPKYSHYFRI